MKKVFAILLALVATITTMAQTTLPVTFSSVTATNKGVVTFVTTAEVNAAQYDIELSTDGVAYNRVTTLVAKGTSGNGGTYGTIISYPSASYVWVRIKQIDNDGKFTYSKDVVKLALGAKQFNAYYSTGKIYIKNATQPTTIVVSNSIGQRVTRVNTTIGDSEIKVGNYPNGVYYCKLGNDSGFSFIK